MAVLHINKKFRYHKKIGLLHDSISSRDKTESHNEKIYDKNKHSSTYFRAINIKHQLSMH